MILTSERSFSTEECALFERDGFVFVRNLYSREEVESFSRAIDQLVGLPLERGKQMAYYETSLLNKKEKLLARIEKFLEYQKELGSLVADDKIVARVAELLGEQPVLFKEKVNFKLPGGSGFTPHQDIQPGWDSYASYFISVSITIDENTEENGCLEFAAGHHKRGLIGRKWEPLEGKELEGITFIKYPTQPGDVVFFDCFAPHQSLPNFTNRPRRSIYLTYNRFSEKDHREQYYSDKRQSFPPDIEREPGREYVFRV